MAKRRYSFNTPAKVMGCFHAAFGGLLIVMGIVARIQVHHWANVMLIGIWTGIVFLSTGAIAIVGAYRRMGMKQKRCYIITFVFMSFISLLLAIFVVVCYAMAADTFFNGGRMGDFSWYDWNEPDFALQNSNKAKGITAAILALGLLELLISIISLIHGLLCCCCRKWHQLKHQELNHRHSTYSDHRSERSDPSDPSDRSDRT